MDKQLTYRYNIPEMLEEYEEKRHLQRTSEPLPVRQPEGKGPPIFVVQKHAARRLHYDLRLEFGGVLKSWSLPNGPSLDPQTRRLAVMVEDHPVGYGSFEGVIPKGEYGAGQVIVWDHGDYSPDDGGGMSFGNRTEAEARMRQGLEEGKISVTLRGHKLKGSWTLVRMKQGNNWLLIKHQDELTDKSRDILDDDKSVLSGLTIEDLKGGRLPTQLEAAVDRLAGIPGARQTPFPGKVRPTLAESTGTAFSSPGWFFEPKLDGYRIISAMHDGNVRLFSRNGLDVTTKYEGIRTGLGCQPAAQLVLDGEVIAMDEWGKPCFQCLQGYLESMGRPDNSTEEVAILYYVFDILYLDGYKLYEVPLILRKRLLERVLRPSGAVRLMEYFEGDGALIYQGAVDQGFEGVIAKRKDSPYEPGRRSPNWLKIKSTRTEDFVIGGYTQGSGNRAKTFGALVLGYYDERNRLIPAGHVGTGFTDSSLNDIKRRLDAIKTGKSPFAVMPEMKAPVTWARPELVAEVRFSQWTRDEQLRAPVYLRLREDKDASQVRRVQAYTVPTPSPEETDSPSRPDGLIADILEQLKKPADTFSIDVERYTVNLSHLDKELWPGDEGRSPVTKRELLSYLTGVSPYLLGHLRDRPITLSRYPDGIRGEQFFQKHWNGPIPEFVETALLSEHHQKDRQYLLCNNLATLLWLGQVADLELHTWFSRIGSDSDSPTDDKSYYPDFIVFDLDPYIYAGTEPPGAEPQLSRKGFRMTCEAAMWLKETLDGLSLSSFVKTSGRTGLHIYVPLLRQFDYHSVHSAAKTICQFVLQHHPGQITTDWSVEKRTGKVFLDYNQNLRGKTLVSVYSPRAAPEATISTPLRWDELDRAYPTDFTILNVPDRLSKLGDVWTNIMSAASDLKHLLGVSPKN